MAKSKDPRQLSLDLSKELMPAKEPEAAPPDPEPEESPPAAKPKPKGGLLKKLLAVAAVLLIMAVAGFFGVRHWVLAQVANPAGGEINLTIKKGSGLRQVANLLVKNHVIKHSYAFLLAERLHPDRRPIQAGEYTLSPSFSQARILDILKDGKVLLYSVMIPEGIGVEETVQRLADAGLVDTDHAMALAHEPAFAKKLGLSHGSLEGYLYPDTYRLPKGMAPEAILTMMVNHFKKAWAPLAEAAKKRGMDRREAVIIASIIEKEALLNDERPVISAVYHNRLKIGMRLQADPTVIYGLEKEGAYKPPLDRKELEVDTPYNTYIHTGLPPGPICSPGGLSLKAAVHPAKVKYLYFVANGQGGHTFSRTYKGQLKAIRAYKKQLRENRKKK